MRGLGVVGVLDCGMGGKVAGKVVRKGGFYRKAGKTCVWLAVFRRQKTNAVVLSQAFVESLGFFLEFVEVGVINTTR